MTTVENRRFSLEEGRRHFLDTVRALAPQVLTDLAGKPFVRFQVFAKRIRRTAGRECDPYFLLGPARAAANGLKAGQRVPPEVRDVAMLDTALDEWSEKWHLADGWIRRTALETLRLWRLEPKCRESRIWESHTVAAEAYRVKQLVVDLSWSPESGIPAHVFVQERLKSAKEAFETYAAQTQAEAQSGSGPCASDQRRFHPITFERLVRFQLLGENLGDLGRNGPADTKNISRSVKDLARFLGVTLRRVPPGRPRGPKGKGVCKRSAL